MATSAAPSPYNGHRFPAEIISPTINGTRCDRGRAGDQHGHVLDLRAQGRRAARAAQPFVRELLQG